MTVSELDNVSCLLRMCGVKMTEHKLKSLFQTLNAHKQTIGEKRLLPQVDKIGYLLKGFDNDKVDNKSLVGYCSFCADSAITPFEVQLGESNSGEKLKLPSYICKKCKIITVKLDMFNNFINTLIEKLGGKVVK